MPSLSDATFGLDTSVVYGEDIDLTSTENAALRTRLSSSQTPCVLNKAVEPFDLVAVNAPWTRLCGYEACEAIGKSPVELLQGDKTDTSKAHAFTSKLMNGKPATMTVLNYSKRGRAFVHRIHSEAVTDAASGETYFLTQSCEEQDPAVSRAVREKAGLPRVSAMDVVQAHTYAVLMALLLIALVLETLNMLATASVAVYGTPVVVAPPPSEGSWYDGFWMSDTYFHDGMPLVG
jgi:PAS domain S-box-containing protein